MISFKRSNFQRAFTRPLSAIPASPPVQPAPGVPASPRPPLSAFHKYPGGEGHPSLGGAEGAAPPAPSPLIPAIEIDAVSIVFGPNPASALAVMDQGASRAEVKSATGQGLGVHDCSLTVNTGEIVVLMGLSGSGKSTLLRAVNGLIPVSRGDVRIRDGAGMTSVTQADTGTLRRLRRSSVAMVFQNFGLLPWRNVRDNVGFGLELAGMSRAERRDRIDAQLDLVGLSDWADHPVQDLSGGMQQRVGLARAFATDAPILLMDEPFSALDPLIRATLQDELLALQDRLGRTILFVSHDLDEAFRIGNRVALLEGGRIVQTGSAHDIVTHPADPYVDAFVARVNPLTVLRACDVTALDDRDHADVLATVIPADTPVRQVIAQLITNDMLRLPDGRIITRASVLDRLLHRTQSPAQ